MSRTMFARAAIATSLAIAAVASMAPTAPLTGDADGTTVNVPPEQKHRGVNWAAGREITPLSIKPLVENNIRWIIQTPFGWQQRFDTPTIRLITSGRVLWGETDEGLRLTAEYARRHGIRTMLKPHIWLREKPDGKWRADIDFPDEDGWRAWFDQYRTFILHYAKFAQEQGIEALCIGTELRNPAVKREADWRRLIADIRDIYDGDLVYAANWWKEYEEIRFWDALDYIGIQGYFPLVDHDAPTVEQLRAGWEPYVKKIAAVSKKYGKPVLFTEQGYRSTRDAAIEPWQWPRRSDIEKVDLQTQANCYEAFFQTFWGQPWVGGVYWWKWYPTDQASDGRGPANADFTPQGKPALDVLKTWFGR